MNKTITFAIALAFCFLLCGCASKEESTINKLTDLTEKIENSEAPSNLDWDKLNAEFAEIEEEAAKCSFSEEQSREYYRQQGKFQAALLKYAIKNLPGLLEKATDAASGYMEGLLDGLDAEEE